MTIQAPASILNVLASCCIRQVNTTPNLQAVRAREVTGPHQDIHQTRAALKCIYIRHVSNVRACTAHVDRA